MAAVLEFDTGVANAVATALGGGSVVLTDANQVLAHMQEHHDPVVVIGPSVDAAVATRITAAAAAADPLAGVIWLRRRVDTPTVLEAIRAGASDVVGESDLPTLVAAAARINTRANHAHQQSNTAGTTRASITTVYASKGGCGKTSIATNLAALMAGEFRHRVLLLDLDLESGDVQLIMSLQRGRSILDLISLENSLDSTSLAACLTPHQSGAYVLAAPRRPEEAAGVQPSLVAKILDVASTMFDQIIVDCPPYATEHVLAALDVADRLALMCTPDAASVKNTAIALEVLEELNFNGEISLVVNRAGDRVGITTSDVAEALQQPVVCEIPHSLEMPLSTNRGKLLALTQPNHDISNAIRNWAYSFAAPAESAQAAEQRTQAAPAKRMRLFGKRVATS